MVNFWNASVERPFALLPSFGFALLIVPLAAVRATGRPTSTRWPTATTLARSTSTSKPRSSAR